jgi:hypothetical protein
MSETVKLIIEIPKEHLDTLKKLSGLGYYHEVIAKGQPLSEILDKISAEIDEKISHYEHFSSSNTANGLMMAKEIIEKYKGGDSK